LIRARPVTERLSLDFCAETWGRWRPSVKAERLGAVAVNRERLRQLIGHPSIALSPDPHASGCPEPEAGRLRRSWAESGRPVLFEYLVDETPVHAICAEATGPEVPPTELPYVRPSSGGAGLIGSGTAFPPMTEICFVATILLGSGDKK
jgi:hypothetical protein